MYFAERLGMFFGQLSNHAGLASMPRCQLVIERPETRSPLLVRDRASRSDGRADATLYAREGILCGLASACSLAVQHGLEFLWRERLEIFERLVTVWEKWHVGSFGPFLGVRPWHGAQGVQLERDVLSVTFNLEVVLVESPRVLNL